METRLIHLIPRTAAASLAALLATACMDCTALDPDIRPEPAPESTPGISLEGMRPSFSVGQTADLEVSHTCGLLAPDEAATIDAEPVEGSDLFSVSRRGNAFRLVCMMPGQATLRIHYGHCFRDFHFVIESADEGGRDPGRAPSDRISLEGIPQDGRFISGCDYRLGALLDGSPAADARLYDGDELLVGGLLRASGTGIHQITAEADIPERGTLYGTAAVPVYATDTFTLYVGYLDGSSTKLSNCGVFMRCSGTESVELDADIRGVARYGGSRETIRVFQAEGRTFSPGETVLLASYRQGKDFVLRNFWKEFSVEGTITVRSEYHEITVDTSKVDAFVERYYGKGIPIEIKTVYL